MLNSVSDTQAEQVPGSTRWDRRQALEAGTAPAVGRPQQVPMTSEPWESSAHDWQLGKD